MTCRMSSGSSSAEIAVDPTKSQNITVSCASLGLVFPRGLGFGGGRRHVQLSNRPEQPAPMPERKAELPQVLLRQVPDDGKIDGILDEALRILTEAERRQPLCNAFHGLPHLVAKIIAQVDHGSREGEKTGPGASYPERGPNVRWGDILRPTG